MCVTSVSALQSDDTPAPGTQPTPTVDRLSAPPTVFPPTQADDGAQLFWLYCQPCHGDKGQGLTDEWRAEYPEDHQNCWTSGCHSDKPYPEGFELPTRVPAVIGEGSLPGFVTADQLFNFVSHEMPLESPGSLSEEEYLAITAFLARAHNARPGERLTVGDLEQVRLKPTPVASATPAVVAAAQPEPLQVEADNAQLETNQSPPTVPLIGAGALALVALIGVALIWLRHR